MSFVNTYGQKSEESESEEKDNHGQSLASWVTVILIILAFAVGTLAVILGAWAWFWGCVALVFVALVVGKILQVMGFGAK